MLSRLTFLLLLILSVSIAKAQYDRDPHGTEASAVTGIKKQSLSSGTSSWTAAQKEKAQKEIRLCLDEMTQAAENLDVEAAMKPYDQSLNFIAIHPDASVSDYEQFVKRNASDFSQMQNLKHYILAENFQFLANKLVLYTWIGRREIFLHTGKMVIDEPYTASLLFSKSTGAWRIVYTHHSAAKPGQKLINLTKK